MQTEYKAKLKDGQVEWSEQSPPTVFNGTDVVVKIDPMQAAKRTRGERGRKMRQALEELARMNAFAAITDPVAWQREIRKDRPLPGRDE